MEPPRESALPGRGRIDLWEIATDQGEGDVLSDEEQRRAAKFATETLRRRWSCARSGLRRVLGAYAGIPAGDLAFVATAEGKLALAEGSGPPELRFNLSHSDALAVCAVTVEAEIGVDVEHMRAIDERDALAAEVMTAAELDHFARSAISEKPHLFFRSWTMKEALAKAIGVGLGLPFNQIEVGFGSEAAVAFAGRTWHLCALAPPAGFAGAVALEAPILDVQRRSLSRVRGNA